MFPKRHDKKKNRRFSESSLWHIRLVVCFIHFTRFSAVFCLSHYYSSKNISANCYHWTWTITRWKCGAHVVVVTYAGKVMVIMRTTYIHYTYMYIYIHYGRRIATVGAKDNTEMEQVLFKKLSSLCVYVMSIIKCTRT